MVVRILCGILAIAAGILITGCATVVPERKATSDTPRILEEDVSDTRESQGGSYQRGAPDPGFGDPSAEPHEDAPPVIEPGDRPRRRLKAP
jgi:hypothetical protein